MTRREKKHPTNGVCGPVDNPAPSSAGPQKDGVCIPSSQANQTSSFNNGDDPNGTPGGNGPPGRGSGKSAARTSQPEPPLVWKWQNTATWERESYYDWAEKVIFENDMKTRGRYGLNPPIQNTIATVEDRLSPLPSEWQNPPPPTRPNTDITVQNRPRSRLFWWQDPLTATHTELGRVVDDSFRTYHSDWPRLARAHPHTGATAKRVPKSQLARSLPLDSPNRTDNAALKTKRQTKREDWRRGRVEIWNRGALAIPVYVSI